MKIYFVSLGCPKNLTDTEVLMGKFASTGQEIVTDPSRAEIIIINTCAFLKSAREEASKTIQEMLYWKKHGKCKRIYLAGCLPKWAEKNRWKIIPREVDGIINSIGPHKCRTPRIKATPPWYAYVKIAEGCSNYCSYCLIPSIRGKVRFRKIDDILEEVKILAGKGVKEIIYVAQDTTAFPNFALLLKKTAKIRGIHWIRIMYAHPSHLSEHLLETISREKKIVKYLDLPIQHVCDSILERMNRRYKRLNLKNLIKKIREKGVALRTSVIVGFPGESEVDFKELLHFIEEVRFERLGVFSFEKEEGTPANKMRGQVSEKRKTERFEKLMRAQARISREMNEKLVGKTFETLIEGMKGGYYFGRTALDAPEIDGQVFIKSENTLRPGEFVKVKISKAKTYDLIGSLT